ncbi:hypothetical protein E8E12_007517 [Didymella heteroderae]|uniref:Uncharacterized protein n=1 Tax=Didymella heteroderae TaxID=1769908 RepID=A0A9P4WZ35_9PLEO|nr:hypothetical protein E8E12_007517 [Didymella heteroderae]
MSTGCYSSLEGYCDRYEYPINYCLSESADPKCRLHFNTVIAVIVTVLNFFKAVLMFYIVYSTKENPLMTIGDAVASFLDEKDVSTKGSGLQSLTDLKKDYSVGVRTWDAQRRRWKDATSRKRRFVTLALFTVTLGLVIGLLIWGVREMNQTQSTKTYDALRLGFGALDPRTVISSGSFPTDMVSLTLIANLPQLILSFLYFAYNGLFTAMLMGYEWLSYAHKRKGLRISRRPVKHQRSTYFLQLPYRFSLPLVVLSGTLHWLVSQSLFVVAFDVYRKNGDEQTISLGWLSDAVTRSVGYSPTAMLAVIILGILMVFTVVGAGYIPYRSDMPLAGSCSLAISAACHPDQYSDERDEVMSEQKLQWGVDSTSADGIGHCAFSSREVGPLIRGRMYM